MNTPDSRFQLLTVATPLFARKGLHGVSVRELARSAGVNLAMISYHFGGKDGLYAAVVEEQFAIFRQMAELSSMNITPAEKFRFYLYQCGTCFHQGSGDEFRPFTASADPAAPECPCCLNNDADSFATLPAATEQAA